MLKLTNQEQMVKLAMSCSRCMIYPACVLIWCVQVLANPIARLPHPGPLSLILLTFFKSLEFALINIVFNFDDASKIGYSEPF